VNRYTSKPIPHPRAHGDGATYHRADLVFTDVDPSGASYRALVFLDQPEATLDSPTFAGWFTVFGHGGCFGDDERHCAPPTGPLDPFDVRPPIGIPKQVKTVQITAALAQVAGDSFTVTVVAVAPGSTNPQPSDELDFGSLHVLTYE
jgi:hypothetical protein